jgi:NAD kinase
VSNSLPRVVLVTRRTPLESLLERFGTRGQVEFYLRSRGQDIGWAQSIHDKLYAALSTVQRAIPPHQRSVRIDRDDLDRFLFAGDDLVVIVGQDGLVPNVAKYLRGQIVIGINPDREQYDGVLCRHPANFALPLLLFAALWRGTPGPDDGFSIEERVMAIARREDGQELRALNEVFIGHASHQSARYRIRLGRQQERHSSSGVIVATGTGATGWARSISEQRGLVEPLPKPIDPRLAWFVREPFPSVATGTAVNFGFVDAAEALQLESEMDESGVIFADGIETDRVEFLTGQRCEIRIAPERLRLVV